jgi:hypothetical protein
MKMFTKLSTAAAVVGGVAAAPAAAQYYPQPTYPQAYPQPAPGYYPQSGYYPQPGYGQPGYGYDQQGGIGAVIGQLLGNRYNVTDRTAVQQCATAAMTQAAAQYRTRPYGNAYGYNNQGYQQGYNPATMMRVSAITNVERRNNGLRVSGLLDNGAAYQQPPYGQAYGYRNNGYRANANLSFRCNVDYRGVVTNLRVRRANANRG